MKPAMLRCRRSQPASPVNGLEELRASALFIRNLADLVQKKTIYTYIYAYIETYIYMYIYIYTYIYIDR